MKNAAKIIEIIGRLMALALVGTLFVAAVKTENHPVALGLAVVFLLLTKFGDVDVFKVSLKDKSLEIRDDDKK